MPDFLIVIECRLEGFGVFLFLFLVDDVFDGVSGVVQRPHHHGRYQSSGVEEEAQPSGFGFEHLLFGSHENNGVTQLQVADSHLLILLSQLLQLILGSLSILLFLDGIARSLSSG